jgi:hypothetical protein
MRTMNDIDSQVLEFFEYLLDNVNLSPREILWLAHIQKQIIDECPEGYPQYIFPETTP